MHVQAKKSGTKNKKTLYYIRYWENGKNKCVPAKITGGGFLTEKDAQDWIQKHGAKAEVKRYTDGLKQLKWRDKYPSFNEYLKKFEDYQKKKAPNSYESSIHYLTAFVFRYFLVIRNQRNMNTWYQANFEFKTWLEQEAFKKGTTTPISYATKNNIIRTYNTFMKCMSLHKVVDRRFALKCSAFERRYLLASERGFKDLISDIEYARLKKQLVVSKDFFIVLMNTGMRFREAYSLPFSAIVPGAKDLPDFLVERFKKLKRKIYGYIFLESQCASLSRNRDKNGKVARKPLKSTPAIGGKYSRLIPVTDKEAWNIIVERYNQAIKSHETRENISEDPEDYFLFNESYNDLRREFAAKTKNRGFHICRHSYVTKLVGETRCLMTTRMVTAHRSDAFEKYVHIFEQSVLQAKRINDSGTKHWKTLNKVS